MAFCNNCGTNLGEGAKFCPTCGNATTRPSAAECTTERSGHTAADPNDLAAKFAAFNNTADTSARYSADDIAQNKAMAILAYFGPLVLIPIFAAKPSKFARFHANQGLLLLIACVAYSIVYSILSTIVYAISWRLGFIVSIIGLVGIVFTVLSIIGIVNAASGKAKELPLIGKYRILK